VCVSEKGDIYKRNSFLLVVDYRWQDHMPAGVVARAIAESHDTLCVCVGARVLLVLLFSSCLTLST